MRGLKRTINSLLHALPIGLKAADDQITAQGDVARDGESIVRTVTKGGVFSDMLEQKVTQEVEELRDKYYRVLKEADQYVWESDSAEASEDGFIVSGHLRKKTAADFMKHVPVFEKEGFSLRTIQDNKKERKNSSFAPEEEDFTTEVYNYDTTISIKTDFIPRFSLEKFVKKVVVRNNDSEEGKAEVDLYLPTDASQFGKIDAILISNLATLLQTKNKRDELVDIKEVEWYSDKAWNSPDVCHFKYDGLEFEDINVFDGSYVLTFKANIVEDGTYIAEKFKTKSLDEKYEKNEIKHDGTDIFAIKRKMEKKKGDIDLENITSATLKL